MFFGFYVFCDLVILGIEFINIRENKEEWGVLGKVFWEGGLGGYYRFGEKEVWVS